jgi:hypothetical protein
VNRLGFFMLTAGGILAFLGWHDRQDMFAAIGFVLLIGLSVLTSAWPTSISYKPDVEALPMGRGARILWGVYYGFAFTLLFLGLFHTGAGGNGQWLIASGLALLGSLGMYDAFHTERLRAWQLTRGAAGR